MLGVDVKYICMYVDLVFVNVARGNEMNTIQYMVFYVLFEEPKRENHIHRCFFLY